MAEFKTTYTRNTRRKYLSRKKRRVGEKKVSLPSKTMEKTSDSGGLAVVPELYRSPVLAALVEIVDECGIKIKR